MKLPFKKIFKWSAIILVLVFCARVCSCDPSNITAAPAIYRSAEDFYKLTLVEFPELVLKDSSYYDDGGGFLVCSWFHEYTYEIEEGKMKELYGKLDKACKEDSTHWSATSSGYHYFICPDSSVVDRTQKSCDRMVKMEDGTFVPDWDGTYISVDLEGNIVNLKQGWVR